MLVVLWCVSLVTYDGTYGFGDNIAESTTCGLVLGLVRLAKAVWHNKLLVPLEVGQKNWESLVHHPCKRLFISAARDEANTNGSSYHKAAMLRLWGL